MIADFYHSQGNILGPLTFRNSDAPLYLPAKLSIVVVDSVAIAAAVALLCYYRWQNKKRDAAVVEHTRIWSLGISIE
jgi:hypothetical protein